MADQTELAFIRTLVKTIAAQPVVFDDDYQAPPHLALRRVPVLPVRTILSEPQSWTQLLRRSRSRRCQNARASQQRRQVGRCHLTYVLTGEYFMDSRCQHYVQILEASLHLHARGPAHRHHLRYQISSRIPDTCTPC